MTVTGEPVRIPRHAAEIAVSLDSEVAHVKQRIRAMRMEAQMLEDTVTRMERAAAALRGAPTRPRRAGHGR